MKKVLGYIGALGLLVCATSAVADMWDTNRYDTNMWTRLTNSPPPPPRYTNDFSRTNFNCYTNFYLYTNRWMYTNGGTWWTNTTRWTNVAPPRIWTNHHRIVPPTRTAATPPPAPRPTLSGAPTPSDVQAMIRQFQTDRDQFIAQQKQLMQQMQTATEQQREKIREQQATQIQQWQAQQAQWRQQIRDQAEQMRDNIRDHSRILDQAGGTTRSGTANSPAGGNRGR